ncbi:CRISPR-associated protein Cas4 [Aeribacillus pallidus]|uniref:CRISPR-associated exonuclease Cas4 n=1 Tax=Aeribacillus pallidus TaxID=33936 RepID=A0A165Y1P2_9BACI|nr:CRISPR-associated protein Cas4 [Aeribacillus pallidus]
MSFVRLDIQGIKVHYYFVCKRKLWLFSKGIQLESEHEKVAIGQLLHEHSYKRVQMKEKMVDDVIKLDLVDDDYVREVKMSSKMEKADRMQLLYYLYYLKQMGIEKKGKLHYPKEKRTEEIELTSENEVEIEKLIKAINAIQYQPTAPKVKRLPYCSSCAYYSFCFAQEE